MDAVQMLDYDVVDVFTGRPFAGNQLAVVHGTQGLSAGQLLALTQEFGYSESAFPVAAGQDRYRLRIFTPGGELPFAGHPSIGAAWVLRARGRLGRRHVVQECGAGPVGLDLGDSDDDLVWLSGAAVTYRGVVSDQEASTALAAVGLGPADLAGPAIVVAGTGLDFCYLLVRPDALPRVAADLVGLRLLRASLEQRLGCAMGGISVVAWAGDASRAAGSSTELTVRVFSDDAGAVEDPATGSAALGLQVALVRLGLLARDGAHDLLLSQGGWLDRPSELRCRVEVAAGAVVRCQVGGRVVPVARGTIRVPPRIG